MTTLLTQYRSLNDLRAVGHVLGFKDFVAHDLAAVDVDDQVQIKELAANPGRQWSKRPGVVELSPCLSSPNRTCTSQRIRLSI